MQNKGHRLLRKDLLQEYYITLHCIALHYIAQVCLINWYVAVHNGTVSEICQAESPTVSPERVRRQHPTCSWSQSLTRQFACLSLLAVQFDNYPGRGKKSLAVTCCTRKFPVIFPHRALLFWI